MNQKLKIIVSGFVLISSSLAIATLGNACGRFESNLSFSGLSACDGKEDINVYAKRKTVSTSYGTQVLSNMRSCLGLRNISIATKLEYDSRKDSFSEYGYANEVTAPMLMGITSLAGEICNDFVNEEVDRGIASELPYVFDFANLDLEDSFMNIAHRCWGRNPTNNEIDDVVGGISNDFNSEPELAAVAMCTVVLSSLPGIEM